MLTCLILAALAADADWPMFRGPSRDDVSPDTGLLKEWPEGGPPLLWTGTGAGVGYSAVTVAGDKVFTMGDKDGKSSICALSRSTGKALWSKPIGGASTQRNQDWGGSRCTPAVSDGLVYGITPRGELAALKVADGSVVWRKDFKKDYGGSSGGWEFAESPLIDGDRLVCTPGGKAATIVCLNKKTGKEVWKSAAGGQAGYASIVIGQAGGVKQYVTLLAGGTVGVDAQSGKLLWSYDKFAGNTANIPTPIVLGDQVFTLAGYGKAGALLTLTKKAGGTFDVKEEYYETKLKNKHGGAVVVGDLVFADSQDGGRPYAAAWKTGEVKWVRKGGGKGSGSASLTFADGHLYLRYANGVMALVPAAADGYEEKGGFQIPRGGRSSWSHPVVVGGRLYLREDDKVYCYDVKAK